MGNLSDTKREEEASTLRPIYVASRASLPERGQMWRDFRARGYPITSTWIDEDGEGATESMEELWLRITSEIAASVALVLYAESGDFPLKGALIEAGVALGMGKPVIVCLPRVEVDSRSCRPVGSWIKHPLVTRVDNIKSAVLMASAFERRALLQQPVTSERCGECGHGGFVNERGVCQKVRIKALNDDGFDLICGCKCVYPATGAPIRDYERGYIEGHKAGARLATRAMLADVSRAEVVEAITDMQEGRDSHQRWLDHLSNPAREDCQGWIEKYDRVIRLLALVPLGNATTSAVEGDRKTLHYWTPDGRGGCVHCDLNVLAHPETPKHNMIALAAYQQEYERLLNWRDLWIRLSNTKRFQLASQNERIEAKAARANRLIGQLIADYDAATPPVPRAAEKCPICGDPAPAGACCGGYACKKPPTAAPATDTNDEVIAKAAQKIAQRHRDVFPNQLSVDEIVAILSRYTNDEVSRLNQLLKTCDERRTLLGARNAEARQEIDRLRAELEAAQERLSPLPQGVQIGIDSIVRHIARPIRGCATDGQYSDVVDRATDALVATSKTLAEARTTVINEAVRIANEFSICRDHDQPTHCVQCDLRHKQIAALQALAVKKEGEDNET